MYIRVEKFTFVHRVKKFINKNLIFIKIVKFNKILMNLIKFNIKMMFAVNPRNTKMILAAVVFVNYSAKFSIFLGFSDRV
jgi:hypothetical protein